jgi:hypothetical protein
VRFLLNLPGFIVVLSKVYFVSIDVTMIPSKDIEQQIFVSNGEPGLPVPRIN